jgi:Mg-chelatase subunit ChlD
LGEKEVVMLRISGLMALAPFALVPLSCISPLDLEGESCPCDEGFVCCETTQTCVATDAECRQPGSAEEAEPADTPDGMNLILQSDAANRILLVVDTSASMTVNDPDSFRSAAIRTLIDSAPSEIDVKFAIMTFNTITSLLTDSANGAYTTDPDVLEAALAKVDTAEGFTNYLDALAVARHAIAVDTYANRRQPPDRLHQRWRADDGG